MTESAVNCSCSVKFSLYSQEFTEPEKAMKFVHHHFQLNDNREIVFDWE